MGTMPASNYVQRTISVRLRACWIAAGSMVLFAAVGAWGAPTTPISGESLYHAHCARCHGPNARGDGQDASLFPEPPRNLRDGVLDRYETDALVRRVRDGRALALTLDPTALRARLQQIDTLQAHLRRIPTIDWPAAHRGQASMPMVRALLR